MIKYAFKRNDGLRIVVTICFLVLSTMVLQAQKYAKVTVNLEHTSLSKLIELGVDIEHGILEKDNRYTAEFSSNDIAILRDNNIRYEILIDDVVQYFLDENKKPTAMNSLVTGTGCATLKPRLTVPSHWYLGAMGGYFTYAQMLQILDSMALLFPNLITIKKPASSTLVSREGRPLYVVKISDNPNLDEANEPKVLYTALHHAREPLSMSQLIMFMYYVLENYATNSQIKYILDNSQMYFMPCLNPDGYLYNQSTNPNGGGMWRKNRVQNADLSYGVDLNRNYDKFWGYDNLGSSNIPSNETFRGTVAFSEPETRIVKEFSEANQFLLALNYHTYGNHIIYPWDYKNVLTSDSIGFKTFGGYITEESKYRYGTCYETLNYVANGGSDDWFYGEQTTKNKTFAFTPECGSSFWMPASQVTETCQNLLEQNIKFTQLALDHARLSDLNSKSLSATSGYIKFSIQRLGLKNTDTFTVKMIPVSTAITTTTAPKKIKAMALLQLMNDSFAYTINPALVVNRKISYVLQVSKGGFMKNDTIEKVFSDSMYSAFQNKGTNLTGWTNSGTQNWSLSNTNFISAPTSIHDSPGADYLDQSSYIITNDTVIDLTKTTLSYLEFYAKWDIEKEYDYVQVMVSEAGKNSWVPLCGLYTSTGTVNQDIGNPVFDGAKNTWVKEYMDLNSWLGKKIQLRLQLITDNGTTRDGFYIDDINIIRRGVVTKTGIDHDSPISIQIEPNPAINSIKIKLKNVDIQSSLHYQITDFTGRVVGVGEASDDPKAIDISWLSKGVYLLVININGIRGVQKFVVQ